MARGASRTAVFIAAGAAFAATLFACSRFGDGDAEPEQPEAAPGADGSPDGAPPPFDSGDSGDSASSGDSGAAFDGALPGDILLARGGSCLGHSYCADFEQSATNEWDLTNTQGGGGLTKKNVAGNDSAVLETTIPALSTGFNGTAYVTSRFDGAQRIRTELDINVAKATLNPGATVTIFQLSGNSGLQEAGLVVFLRSESPNLAFYADIGGGQQATVPASQVAFPTGQWVHLIVDVRFGSRGHVFIQVGSSVALQMPLATLPPTMPALRVGLQRYAGVTPALLAYHDTVRVDAWSGQP